MILISGPTRTHPKQLRLEQLFSVERVLSSRGFSVEKEGNGVDTILEKSAWTQQEADMIFGVFNIIDQRIELLHYIEDKIEKENLSVIISNLIKINEFKKDRQCFSTTFEWYIGELLVRKFQAFSSSYGVKVKNICRNSDGGTSGDFDVLSILGDMNLLYVECKTGKISKDSITNTLHRSISLHCVASVFVGQKFSEEDLKNKLLSLNHPIFEGTCEVYKLNIKSQPESVIYKWFNCYFVNASEESGNLENKLKAVLRIIEGSRYVTNMAFNPSDDDYKAIGYNIIKL